MYCTCTVSTLFTHLLVRLVEPVRVEEEPRLESRPRWPVGEVTDEEVVVVVEEEDEEVVVEELKSSCLLPKEPLEDKASDTNTTDTSVRHSSGEINLNYFLRCSGIISIDRLSFMIKDGKHTSTTVLSVLLHK